MSKIVAVANQKGGVGKTTTAVNLAAAVGYLGKRVLMVDSDPQGNATSGFGVDKRSLKNTIYTRLCGDCSFDDAVVKTRFKGVDLLPADMNLAGAELELVDVEKREYRLKNALAGAMLNYDFVFIDCPPSLGLVTINALTAADTVLIPIQCEYYALEGLSQLIATVRQVKQSYNSSIEVEGVLLTMYDGRLNLTQQVAAEVKKFFPRRVYKSFIPRTVRLSEAPGFGQPVIYYDIAGRGSEAYMNLAREFLKNNR